MQDVHTSGFSVPACLVSMDSTLDMNSTGGGQINLVYMKYPDF